LLIIFIIPGSLSHEGLSSWWSSDWSSPNSQ